MSSDDDSLCCPITHELFRDPVKAEDGRLYERDAIIRWINQTGTSPFTRQVLSIHQLQPDEHMKKRANQRRVAVTYNRNSDQVKLPQIRSTRNVNFDNIVVDIRHLPKPPSRCPCFQNIHYPDICASIERCECVERCCESIYDTWDTCDLCSHVGRCCECICGTCCSCSEEFGCTIFWTCVSICIIIPIIVPIAVLAGKQAQFNWPSSSTMSPYVFPPPVCDSMNQTFVINPCIASFTNITIIDSGTWVNFSYQFMGGTFQASALTTTIIFAFEQTSGDWNLDNIRLFDMNQYQNVFQNGDFESGSLTPDYSQCQSSGYIDNSSQFSGNYCYSDNTSGQFGYLMQNVSTIVGISYYIEFYLQNINGPSSSFMVLVGT